MRVAIVGHEAAKFTPETERLARELIRRIIQRPGTIVVSGKCPLGGIDIWAAEEGREAGLEVREYAPEVNRWDPPDGRIGFQKRNLQIAEDCDEAHCIVVDKLPIGYVGRRFEFCYHCARKGLKSTPEHVKSGGCWTVIRARDAGAQPFWHVIRPGPLR